MATKKTTRKTAKKFKGTAFKIQVQAKVKETNAAWFRKHAAKKGITNALIMDSMISAARNKKVFNVSTLGN